MTESGTVVPVDDVPAPLGWCSSCLADRDRTRPAVTVLAGTALCRDCNREAAHAPAEQQEQMAALAAQAEQQLRGLFGAQPPSGGRAGF